MVRSSPQPGPGGGESYIPFGDAPFRLETRRRFNSVGREQGAQVVLADVTRTAMWSVSGIYIVEISHSILVDLITSHSDLRS